MPRKDPFPPRRVPYHDELARRRLERRRQRLRLVRDIAIILVVAAAVYVVGDNYLTAVN